MVYPRSVLLYWFMNKNVWLLYKGNTLRNHTEKSKSFATRFKKANGFIIIIKTENTSKRGCPDLIIHHLFRKNLN